MIRIDFVHDLNPCRLSVKNYDLNWVNKSIKILRKMTKNSFQNTVE